MPVLSYSPAKTFFFLQIGRKQEIQPQKNRTKVKLRNPAWSLCYICSSPCSLYFLVENMLEDLVEIKFSFSDYVRKAGSGTRK